MITRQKLIKRGLIQEWASKMCPSLREEILKIIEVRYTDAFLNLHEEMKIKKVLNLNSDEISLLKKLLNDCNGLPWGQPSYGCPSKTLVDLALARFDAGRGESLLKATKYAFDPSIQFLIGMVRYY
jgi:hypothetical protein